MMTEAESLEGRAVPDNAWASFSWDDQEDFRWLCRHWDKNPDDFTVEVREHVPGAGSAHAHRDVVVVYRPSGKGRGYCPDYGKSWIVKFSRDLKLHYFLPRDAAQSRGLVVWS